MKSQSKFNITKYPISTQNQRKQKSNFLNLETTNIKKKITKFINKWRGSKNDLEDDDNKKGNKNEEGYQPNKKISHAPPLPSLL